MDFTGPKLNTMLEITIVELESRLSVNGSDIALALGTSLRSLRRWRSGENHPRCESRANLARLIALAGYLDEDFGEDVGEWLHADSRYLEGLKPIEALRAGRIDQVEDALEALDSGVIL